MSERVCVLDGFVQLTQGASALPTSAVAIGLVKTLEVLSRNEEPCFLEAALHDLWLAIAPHMAKVCKANPTSKEALASVVLEHYFAHRGDWKKMAGSMRQHVIEHTGAPGLAVDHLTEQIFRSANNAMLQAFEILAARGK
jgi:hypothetical protein